MAVGTGCTHLMLVLFFCRHVCRSQTFFFFKFLDGQARETTGAFFNKSASKVLGLDLKEEKKEKKIKTSWVNLKCTLHP